MRRRKSKIEQWAIVPVMGFLWFVALTYGSGLGVAYDVYGKTRMLVLGIFLFLFVFKGKFQRIPARLLLSIGLIAAGCLVVYIRFDKTILDYLWVWLLIPLIAELPVEKEQMRRVSLLYGVLGGLVLFVANYGTLFRGWNPNALGMIAFFSYMVFIGAFSEVRNKKVIFALVVYSAIYFTWIGILNARSSALFSIAAFLCVFSIIPLRTMRHLPQLLDLVLLVPLIIAVVIVAMQGAEVVDAMNHWSIGRFGKEIFNGRERLWSWGLRVFWQAPLFGHGTFAGNFHNSAVTMLYGAGVSGFLVWIRTTRSLIRRGLSRMNDPVVYGLMIAFLMIWLQQSLELGLIAPQANVIPYGILGLLLGRIKTLEKQDAERPVNSDPGL